MGNINKAHIEAMKALQNAKDGSEISEENARAVKEAHHKFLEEQNKRNEPEKTEESSSPNIGIGNFRCPICIFAF